MPIYRPPLTPKIVKRAGRTPLFGFRPASDRYLQQKRSPQRQRLFSESSNGVSRRTPAIAAKKYKTAPQRQDSKDGAAASSQLSCRNSHARPKERSFV